MKKNSKKQKEELESKKIKTLKKKSSRISIGEGILWSVRNSFGDYYISPFAIALNSSNSLIAMITAISGLLGPATQIFSSKKMESYSRKKLVTKAVFLESFMWIFFIAAGFLFYKNIIPSLIPIIFISIFAVYIIIANFATPPWFSWMGDLIEDDKRGKWLSTRNVLIGFSTVILVIGSSFFLEYLKQKNLSMLGFGIFFFIAFIARLKCWKMLKKEYEPKMEFKKIKEETPFTFVNFLKKAPKTNFGKFAIFRFSLGASVVIYSSLLSVYLLRELSLNYIFYMIIVSSSTVFSIIVMEVWGKVADKFGNYKVMAVTTMFIPLIPLIWILFDSVIYLIIVPGLFVGIAWGGFNIASNNFIYDNVRSEKRGRAISYYNMMMGLGTFTGGVISAILIKMIKTSLIKSIPIIFIISSVLSMIVVYYWVPKIAEIKNKSSKNPKNLQKFIMKTLRPTVMEEAHQIMHMKKYLVVK